MKDNENNLVVVVIVLREVRVATMSIAESLMSLMSMPSPNNKKSNKGYFGSKLMRVNSFSSWEKCDEMTLQCANKRLEAVEIGIEYLEGELECRFSIYSHIRNASIRSLQSSIEAMTADGESNTGLILRV